jgi:hypothetical protein
VAPQPVYQVSYRSDKADGPTGCTATVDPLEFLARLVTHLPDPGQGMQRLLRLGRQPHPGPAATPGRSRDRGAGGDRRAGRLDPPRRAVPLGRTAPPDLRGGPPRLPPLPGADAHRRRDHGAAVITRILVHRARGREPSQR